MSYAYAPCKRISLREAGYDEAWLQKLVLSDPSVLGLGDLKSVGREVRQKAGGRLDFLLLDADSETMYEVELMLGATDESHIIRTLEYWDIESRRWPSHEHRAVIVAEEITNRFFNVIWLLNRSIPIIALKLDTLVTEGRVTVAFTKVLDIYEAPEGREPTQPETTRQHWVDWARPESIAVFDKCISLLKRDGKEPRITYNDGHIAIGGQGKNFAWFYPRRQRPHCKVEVLVGESSLDMLLQKLSTAGVDASRQPNGVLRMVLGIRDLEANKDLLREALETGAASGGGL